MSGKCTMAHCGEEATHVVRWRGNTGQRFCYECAKGVYLRDTNDTTTLEQITTGKGNDDSRRTA